MDTSVQQKEDESESSHDDMPSSSEENKDDMSPSEEDNKKITAASNVANSIDSLIGATSIGGSLIKELSESNKDGISENFSKSSEKLITSEVADFSGDLQQNLITEDHRVAVKNAFTEALSKRLTDPASSLCLINQDKDNSYLFTLGLQFKGNSSQKKLFCFLRFDENSKSFWHELFSSTIEGCGIELFQTLRSSSQDYMYKALLILRLYGLIDIPSKGGSVFRLCPDAFWQQKYSTLHFFDAVLLSDNKIAFPDASPLTDSISDFLQARILFEDYNAFPYLEKLSFFSLTGLKQAAVTREFQISGTVSNNVAKHEGDVSVTAPESAIQDDEQILDSSPDMTIESVFSNKLSQAFDKDKDNSQQETFASKNFIDVNRHLSTVNDNSSIVKRADEEELKYEVNKRILRNCNIFKADLDEENQIRRLQDQQHFYYFTENEVKTLRELNDSEKKDELELVRQLIVDKLKNKEFAKLLFKEIEKALTLSSSYINFKEIGNGNYYAAF
ncbi:MAG: hypothetical protein ACI4M9_07110, partial [Succinivibrio sp.]